MTLSERSEIQFGLTRIPYVIRRSRRRATVAIAIDAQEGVVISAPESTPVDRLDGVVRSRAGWIMEKLRRRSDLPPPLPPRDFISGETFLYLGRQYRLLVGGEYATEVGLQRGWLAVPVAGALSGEERARSVREALVGWYRARAAERLRERIARWAQHIGVAEPPMLVREQRRRWGSCDADGMVRLNWRVIQAPMRLVDYVVAHELVHLKQYDHSRAFWARLGRAMPDYEARKAELRKVGPTLAW